MNLVPITINGNKISVNANMTILEAATSVNIYIPRLCSHPDLPLSKNDKPITKIFQDNKEIQNTIANKSAKKCGLCIVKINEQNEFINSCTTQVKKGMQIITDNEGIQKQRKKNLSQILSRHPHACLTCAQQEGCSQTQCSSNIPENERCCKQFGNCELQNITMYIGIPTNTPKWSITNFPIINNEPLFKRNYNLCIGCTRCVRICNNVRETKVLGFVWDENNNIQVGTISPTLEKSGCKFCTACVEICPTGAIQDKFKNHNNKKEDNIVSCKASCPVHINIPEYLRMIANGKIHSANTIIREKVPFPKTLGRICTHPCESSCRRNEINDPIAICNIKRFATKTNTPITSNVNQKAISKTNKKIAVIGAGPAGLTASFYLKKMGHDVVLYDENELAGGMLQYGIPKYRLPKKIANNEINSILSTGIDFKPNHKMGINFNIEELQNKGFNIILIALGAQAGITVTIGGEIDKNIINGIDFLRKIAKKEKIKIKNNVAIIGGGNVAIDTAMSALRCRAKNVTLICLETEKEMPASKSEIEIAKLEKIKILSSWGPKKIIYNNKEKNITGLEIMKCIRIFDKNKKFNPSFDNKITKNIPCDQIISSVGQRPNLNCINGSGILINKEGFIVVDEDTLETSVHGIYAIGDVTSIKNKTVIDAIAEGKKAANSINRTLGGTRNIDKTLYIAQKKEIITSIGRTENFIKMTREHEKILNIKDLNNNFDEIFVGLDKKQSIQESSRCLQCDLRLNLKSNPYPPIKKQLAFTLDNISTIPEKTEGVYKLFDKNNTVIAISGSQSPHNDLVEIIKTNDHNVEFFEFEADKLYSKKESELIQKHLREFGEMPIWQNGNDSDDLF